MRKGAMRRGAVLEDSAMMLTFGCAA
jgi:hypothetical protein